MIFWPSNFWLSNSANKKETRPLFMAAQAHTSSSKHPRDHHVFLSFRGEETRTTFTDHLYSALMRVGIRTFRDENELPKGENISQKLINGIHGSKISIVVFSKGYAFSRWCLDELVEIVDCAKTRDHTLIPIFYHVEPSDVRKQERTFASAFSGCEEYEGHETRFEANMERVQRWREALRYAGNCAGWNLTNCENRYESKCIEEVVEEVFVKVKPGGLDVAKYPVGLDSRVKQMKDLLKMEVGDVHIIGIYGMGGIGKTTLAKAVYNQICDGFQGSCFLSNVKENSQRCDGVVRLQEQLLSNILKAKNFKIDDIDEGIKLIEDRIQGKRILVVLDDIDDMKQVYNLVQSFGWFGSGSRVIATTRDAHFLTQLGVKERYKVEILNQLESLQLFSWQAFGMSHPREGYQGVSACAVKYAGGLPLALEVLGSFLSKRTIDDWKEKLEELRRTPDDKIQRIIRTSFTSLSMNAKNIFLDITCFFIDMKKENVIEIFKGRGLTPGISIGILVERSLVTIVGKRLRMHDLVRDVGREIVREESFRDPGKRSRIWFHEDALNVLRNHTGSDAVEGLALDPRGLKEEHFQTEAFASMKNLQLLQVNGAHISGCFEQLSGELRWLSWHKCPLKLLPENFHLEHLVVLEMRCSNVKQVWKKNNMVMNKLKVLNLSYSINLSRSPNFSQVPNLERLILKGCTSLVELHKSLGHLKGLVLLDLTGCENLRNNNILECISKLKSLETLGLSGCLKFNEVVEKFMVSKQQTTYIMTPYDGCLSNLGYLSSLRSIRQFLGWWSHLSLMMISGTRSISHFGFRTLDRLVLRNHNFFEDQVLVELGSLTSLRILDLSKNNFRDVPHFINDFPRLEVLVLNFCNSLLSISHIPENIKFLNLSGSTLVERISLPSNSNLMLFVRGCCKLVEIEGLSSRSIIYIVAEECHNLSSYIWNMLLQSSIPWQGIMFSASEIPDWFTHKSNGSSISFPVPSASVGEICGLNICVVYGKKRMSQLRNTRLQICIQNKTRGYGLHIGRFPEFPVYDSDTLYLARLRVTENTLKPIGLEKEIEMESGEEIEVSCEVDRERLTEVKKCGAHFQIFYGEKELMEMARAVQVASCMLKVFDEVVTETDDTLCR